MHLLRLLFTNFYRRRKTEQNLICCRAQWAADVCTGTEEKQQNNESESGGGGVAQMTKSKDDELGLANG